MVEQKNKSNPNQSPDFGIVAPDRIRDVSGWSPEGPRTADCPTPKAAKKLMNAWLVSD